MRRCCASASTASARSASWCRATGASRRSARGLKVILSAGAFNSPQLLMCSGIGPVEQLRRHGIAVVHDAPEVGTNLSDHIDFIVNTRVNSSELVGICLRGIAKMTPALARYLSSRTGIMTSNVAEAGGFIKSDPSLDRPDLQLHFCAALVDDHNRKMHWGSVIRCTCARCVRSAAARSRSRAAMRATRR
jgi:choline dehydrogenase-like flavoprotein